MSSYNVRVPADMQYQLIIMECRSSGLTDFQWCKEHGIHPEPYNWVSRLRKEAPGEIPESISKVEPAPSPAQNVVRFNQSERQKGRGIHVSSSGQR